MDRFIELLLTTFPNVTCLDFTNMKELSPSGIEKAVKLVKSQVETLILDSCRQIPSKTLHFLFSSFPSLKKINFAGCSQVTENDLSALVSNCKELRDIDISR
jgi:hypothetical protein